jgi:peroxisomal 2,4-dienoyl-CoA reductase
LNPFAAPLLNHYNTISNIMTPQPKPSPFLPTCLQGKVALVTGGGSGICFEVTNQLLQHGCVGAVICGRRQAFLEKACVLLNQQNPGVTVKYFCLDVRDSDKCVQAVQYCLQHFGRLDILVNGAAGNFLAPAEFLKPKGFRTVLEIDALGTYHMTHAAFGALRDSIGDAIVINISATLQYGATWYQAHASAVDSLTRSLALEWGTYGIRVVGIAPGPIADTPGMTKLAPGVDAAEMEQEFAKETVPLERWGRKEEIGHAAIYLCTAEYVTGDVLVVDGGQWLWKPPVVPREMVTQLAKQVESKSRAQGPASKTAPKVRSKL